MQPQQPTTPGTTSPPNHEHYDFILNPPKPPRKTFGSGSPLLRVLLVLVGLLVVLVLFSIIKNAFFPSKSNLPALTSVLQQQAEIIHLSTNALQATNLQTSLSAPHKNFAINAQLSLTSEQTKLIGYLATNHQKVSPKVLNAGISAMVDKQITDSQAASTYDSTFGQIMQTELTTYESSLSQAYKLTTGTHGRQLLSADYTGAQLLLKQLNTMSSQP